jgi:hypothetical protein
MDMRDGVDDERVGHVVAAHQLGFHIDIAGANVERHVDAQRQLQLFVVANAHHMPHTQSTTEHNKLSCQSTCQHRIYM